MNDETALNRSVLLGMIKILKKIEMKETHDALCKEANVNAEECVELSDAEVTKLLSVLNGSKTKRNDDTRPADGVAPSERYTDSTRATDVDQHLRTFEDLKRFVDEALDIYKYELSLTLFPILVQIYARLIAANKGDAALELLLNNIFALESFYHNDLKTLLLATRPEQLEDNEILATMEHSKFMIRMSRDSHSIFRRYLQDRRQQLASEIVANYVQFETYEGMARNKRQCLATAGAYIGEARRQDNKIRIYYGLLKEADYQSLTNSAAAPQPDDDDEDDTADKPKKKKAKRDPYLLKKSKSDPNAPPPDRIPLPELKDNDKVLKCRAFRESIRRVTLNKETLPSVCMHTVLNTNGSLTSTEISEDSSLLACGFSNGLIRVWSLTPTKLLGLKHAAELKEIDKDAADISIRMMDEYSGKDMRQLSGHSGAVYRCSFSPDFLTMLSCSSDGTIRLWSLMTWTCLVVYKGHLHPVWDVCFSPHGHYFVTGSHDKSARLWATDSITQLRTFSGHHSDVSCVIFHPNSNYIASSSNDRTVRIWDVLNAQMVRVMTGHKDTVLTLAFSICGRYLTSAGADHNIIVWDISTGTLVATLMQHTQSIYTLAFSRDGNVLAAGGADCKLSLWDFSKLTEDHVSNQLQSASNEHDDDVYLLRTYASKSTPFHVLHFTRRNMILACGALSLL